MKRTQLVAIVVFVASWLLAGQAQSAEVQQRDDPSSAWLLQHMCRVTIDKNGNIEDIVLTVRDPILLRRALRALQGTVNLREVSFIRCILGPEEAALLGKLRKVRRLNLGRTTASPGILAPLNNLDELEFLWLPRQVTDADVLALTQLSHVTTLLLRRSMISDSALEHFRAHDKLEGLDLTATNVTDKALSILQDVPNLKHLGLGGTGISDAGMVHLRKMRSITSLSIAQTRVTDGAMQNIGDLTKLETLVLPAGVTDEGMVHVQKLKNLRNLDLHWASVGDVGLRYLAQHQELRFLWVGASTTDNGLQHLAALTKLETLRLTNTKVTGGGLRHLKPLKNLRFLCLGGTRVGDDDLRHVEAILPRLTSLTLSDTAVSTTKLEELRKLAPKTTILPGEIRIP